MNLNNIVIADMLSIKKVIKENRLLVVFLVVYSFWSISTVMDFPTVDHTNDDMWHMDRAVNYVQKNVFKQSFFMLDRLNSDGRNVFNWNDLFNAWALKYLDPSVFSMRLKSLVLGLLLLISFYIFSLQFFKNKSIALCSVICLAFTHGFLYRSHDARPEILMSLMYFIFFWISYRFAVDVSPQPSPLWFIFIGLIPLLCFRQIHPNGIVFYLVGLVFFLIFQPRCFLNWRSWVFFLLGIAIFFSYAYILTEVFDFNRSNELPDHSQTALVNEDMLNWIPIYKVADFTSPSSFFKTAFHTFGLILKYPARIAARINHHLFSRYVDLFLIGFTALVVLLQIVVLKHIKGIKFIAPWILIHWIMMSCISGSSTDYSIYFMPMLILTLLSSIIHVSDHFHKHGQRIIAGVVLFQIVFMLVIISKLKYFDQYSRNLSVIDREVSESIPEHSTVIGAPLCFTLLKPKKDMTYIDIRQASGIDWVMKMNTKNTGYDFFTEFDKKRFDYVIFDDFFKDIIEQLNCDPEQFVSKYLSQYEVISVLNTEYPSSRGVTKQIVIYHRRSFK